MTSTWDALFGRHLTGNLYGEAIGIVEFKGAAAVNGRRKVHKLFDLTRKTPMVSTASPNFLNSAMASCISGAGRKVEPTLLAVSSICFMALHKFRRKDILKRLFHNFKILDRLLNVAIDLLKFGHALFEGALEAFLLQLQLLQDMGRCCASVPDRQICYCR